MLVTSISAWQELARVESIIKIAELFDCLERRVTVDMEIGVAVNAAVGPNQSSKDLMCENGESIRK